MAKYVCEIETVRAAGVSLGEAAETVVSKLGTYASDIEGNTSGWTGDYDGAKTAFNSVNTKLIELSAAKIDIMKSLSEFIKNAADAIEKLEGELSGLDI